ncbi:MAG: hypothetical protein V1727_06820 [Candidatus Omnitrophota bacterium]
MIRVIKITLVIFLVAVLALLSVRNTIAQNIIYGYAHRFTNLGLTVDSLNLDLVGSTLTFKGITLFNPSGFTNATLAKIKELSIHYSLISFIVKRPYFPAVKANIIELNIIKNPQGDYNLAFLKQEKSPAVGQPSIMPRVEPANLKEQGLTQKSRFVIGRLELSLQKASFIAYKAGVETPTTIVFSLKGPSVFTNVTDLEHLINSLVPQGGLTDLLSLLGVMPPNGNKSIIKISPETMAQYQQ